MMGNYKLHLTVEAPPAEKFNLIIAYKHCTHIPNTQQIIEVFYGMLRGWWTFIPC